METKVIWHDKVIENIKKDSLQAVKNGALATIEGMCRMST
jgi:hypothetical protein